VSAKETITVDSTQLLAVLLPRLRERVFHVTPIENLSGIEAAGAIQHNGDKKFAFASSMSENSYGRRRNWVCLFDFRGKAEKKLRDVRSDYVFDDPFQSTVHPFLEMPEDSPSASTAYLFLRRQAYARLIPAKNVKQEAVWRTLIRKVECWYPGDIPLSLIESVLVVNIDRTNERQKHNTELERIAKILLPMATRRGLGDAS
jgi:hypothetical protein